ncbi:MAG: hypothetical protein SFU56_00755 [Capsulimonadales bacterium]|nr:hypothetical protein [Capsulimonadales bacterium]
MRVLRIAGEEEMVATFLRAEIASPRWKDTISDWLRRYGFDRRLVEFPDLDSASENAARALILGDFRGYARNLDLFQDYPAPGTIRWEHVVLNGEDLAQVRYIDYSYWNELSDGTRRASVAAETIRRGITVFGVSNDGFRQAAQMLENGERFPELILVRSEGTPPVVLEGHLRLTAYFLAPERTRADVQAFLGTSPAFAHW